MASVFTNNVEGCLDAVYEEIRLRHSDMVDEGKEFTEETFCDMFYDQIREEIDHTVNIMSMSDVNAIIEEIGWIKLVKLYKLFKDEIQFNQLFNDDENDIQIKKELICNALHKSVYDIQDFEIYMDMWKAENESESEGEEEEEKSERKGGYESGDETYFLSSNGDISFAK